jgi:hypothetical protein
VEAKQMGIKFECLVDHTNHQIMLKGKDAEREYLDLVWEKLFSKNAFFEMNHKPKILTTIRKSIVDGNDHKLTLNIQCAGEDGLRSALSIISMAFKVPRASINNCVNSTMIEFNFDANNLAVQQLPGNSQPSSVISESPPNYYQNSVGFNGAIRKRKESDKLCSAEKVDNTDLTAFRNNKRRY